jgi:predicted metal-dependent peptidase
MSRVFNQETKALYETANKILSIFYIAEENYSNARVDVPEDFRKRFFSLVDKVILKLMEDKDNFYGYFLFQMGREIKFNISSPSAVNFIGAKYVIYFNPIIFLKMNALQMESTIKHEILHILSLHLIRARELKGRYSKLTVNLAMDIVVNRYLDNLPPYAITLEWINLKYSLELEPFKSFEYYAERIQTALDLMEEDEEASEEEGNQDENIETAFKPETSHELWENSSDIEEQTLREFTEKLIDSAQKVKVPAYLEGLITSIKNNRGELPWNLYLSRLMGTLESNKKKTVTRRNRRQPERLDLRGELRRHKAKIAVALDISGSISDEEFKQAIKEVLNIIKNYNHEVTIIE